MITCFGNISMHTALHLREQFDFILLCRRYRRYPIFAVSLLMGLYDIAICNYPVIFFHVQIASAILAGFPFIRDKLLPHPPHFRIEGAQTV